MLDSDSCGVLPPRRTPGEIRDAPDAVPGRFRRRAPPGSLSHMPISTSMGSHMKTTVDLPDDLLRRATRAARTRGTTLRELIETGLRLVLRRSRGGERFVLRSAVFEGRGLQAEFADGGWERMRAAAYEGRGG